MSTLVDAAARPRLNTPVLLAVPDVDHDLPSRVEDVRGELVVVAAVSETVTGRRLRLRDGEVLSLAWTAPPRGLLSVAATLVAQERSTPPLWVLRPTGPLRRLQRRRFARADVSARVVMTDAGAGPTAITPAARAHPTGLASADGWSATGMLADLSEGGARVLLDRGQRVQAAVGQGLVLDVRLVDSHRVAEPLVTLADVVGVDTRADGSHQVRLRFELSEREADRVRRAVMQRQAEARCGEERS